MSQIFDFEKALSDFRPEKNLTNKDSVLLPLIKQLTGAAIHAELVPIRKSSVLVHK
jgi:hypothetical protein